MMHASMDTSIGPSVAVVAFSYRSSTHLVRAPLPSVTSSCRASAAHDRDARPAVAADLAGQAAHRLLVQDGQPPLEGGEHGKVAHVHDACRSATWSSPSGTAKS